MACRIIANYVGHATISVTMDTYGHLFNDTDFNRQQVGLLESSFQSVRKPLENGTKKGLPMLHTSTNPLNFLGSGDWI